MQTVKQILLAVGGLAVAGLNLAYWFYFVRRGYPRFQEWITRRYDVVITTGIRGSWTVTGARSFAQLIRIHLLQLGYFLAGFVVWAAALLILVLVLSLVAPQP